MKKLLYALPILILLLWPIAPVYAFTGNLDGRVVFGQNFTLNSGETLDGDLVVFGGEATIEENATVKGNVVIIGGSLVMDGSATGDAVVIGGLMTMGDKSSVAGNVTTVGGSLQRAAGAQVGGQIVTNVPSPNVPTPKTPNVPAPQTNIAMGFNPILRAFGVLGTAIVFAMLAMLLAIFLHEQMDRVAQAIVAEPIIAGGIGLLASFRGANWFIHLSGNNCGSAGSDTSPHSCGSSCDTCGSADFHCLGNITCAGLAVRHHWPRHGSRRTIYQSHPSKLGACAFSWFRNIPIDVRSKRLWLDPMHWLDP